LNFLASNFSEILLGLSNRPKYYLPQKNSKEITKYLSQYWLKRWLVKRIERSEVIQEVKKHRLIYPIEHGARVRLPEIEEEGLFSSLSRTTS
jgi:hypothetical protein